MPKRIQPTVRPAQNASVPARVTGTAKLGRGGVRTRLKHLRQIPQPCIWV
jgi:hypothetical protein